MKNVKVLIKRNIKNCVKGLKDLYLKNLKKQLPSSEEIKDANIFLDKLDKNQLPCLVDVKEGRLILGWIVGQKDYICISFLGDGEVAYYRKTTPIFPQMGSTTITHIMKDFAFRSIPKEILKLIKK